MENVNLHLKMPGARGKDATIASIPLVVHGAPDVENLLKSVRQKRRMPKSSITLSIPGMEEDRQRRIQEDLNATARACGCPEGGALSLLALIGAIGLSVSSGIHGAWLNLAWIWLSALVIVPLCAGVGKIGGKYLARLRFQRILERLMVALGNRERPEQYLGGIDTESERKR